MTAGGSSGGGPSTDQLAADVAGTGLFAAAIWLAVGLVATVVAHAPGVTGRAADRVGRLLLPAALHRLVAGAAGLGVVLAPVAAPGVAGAATTAGPPVAPVTSTAQHAPAAERTPSPMWPTDAPHRDGATDGARVTVVSGDSLWRIAARRLGPHASDAQVAEQWPRIFTANRGVIGDDPDLIRPGQRLTLPPGASTRPEQEQS